MRAGLACWLAGAGWRGWAQSAIAASTDSSAPYTVTGTVVNGLNGSPLPRALVRINGRAVLTDGLGRFSFASFTGARGSVQVVKPGYWNSPDDPMARTSQMIDLTGAVVLKLYPDAVITGVVTGSDRLPAEHAQIILQRENLDGNGLQGIPVGFTQTDSRGEYRFQEPAGHYRILIGYSQRAAVDGTVMLPVDYPESGGAETVPFFTVSSNENRRIDLHPRTATAYPVRFQMEGEEGGYNPRITVKSTTGSSFSVFARNTREPGLMEVMLPSGSYGLRATTHVRESEEEANAHVTVAGGPVEGLVLHFGPVPSIPIELTVDAVTTPSAGGGAVAAQPPRLGNLGLRFMNISRSDQLGGDDVGISGAGNAPPVLQISPGVYRLRAQFVAQWYVRSATYGGANLLTQPLNVADGAGGEPLRITLANDLGQVTGTVTGAAAGAESFVYLLAHQPSLSAVVQVQTSQDGTFGRALPPGSYTAYAFPRRFPDDLHSAEVVARLGAGVDVTVPASGKVPLTLALQPAELTR